MSPIRLLPPQLVEMTPAQRQIAIQSLAVLLRSWLEGGRSPDRDERKEEGSGSPGPLSDNSPKTPRCPL
jgi:hypothetical protein